MRNVAGKECVVYPTGKVKAMYIPVIKKEKASTNGRVLL